MGGRHSPSQWSCDHLLFFLFPHVVGGASLAQVCLRLLGAGGPHYTYMNSLQGLDCATAPQPPLLAPWPVCPSPIRVVTLAWYLQSHPDQQFANFIIRGLSNGFRVGFAASQLRGLGSASRNHPSTAQCPGAISRYISEERAAGRMVGPLPESTAAYVHCSPIGLVPKGRDTGKWRMIVDLSYPQSRSVNEGIDDALCSLKYASMDDALRIIEGLGRGTNLLKVDLKSAYRMVPVHPCDRHLLGIRWGGQLFVDMALPFGLRSAPIIFTAVADAFGWALTQAGIPLLIHYLDDFLFFTPPTNPNPGSLQRVVLDTLYQLGVPVAHEKIEGPAPIVTFLGIVVDTEAGELRIPEEKLAYMRGLVQTWLGKRSGKRREFESLIGHLAHAATVIRDGRIFLRHLFSLLSATRPHFHYIHLDRTAQADLRWWACFLHHWNGRAFFPQPLAPVVHVYTDASGSFGCGGVVPPSHWFQIIWPPRWADVDISVKELLPIVVASAIWGKSWRLSRVCFHTDNMAVVAMLQNRTARDPVARHLLRCLYFYSAIYQFQHRGEHVPGVLNVAADALSRNHMSIFSSLIPQARPTAIPTAVSTLLLANEPDWGSSDWIGLFSATLAIR